MATTLEPLSLRLAPIRLRLHRPVVAATLLAAVLSLIWALFLANDAGDLAAQYAWTDFALKHPDSAYNLSWYGGMHPASYSLFSPYVMGLLGVRTTAVLAATLSATIAARLLVRSGIARPLLPALWAAFSLWCDVASGRVTFALGILFGLAAADLVLKDLVPEARIPRAMIPRALVPSTRRLVAASFLGALATACSPVAGLFVEVLAAALFLTGRRRPRTSSPPARRWSSGRPRCCSRSPECSPSPGTSRPCPSPRRCWPPCWCRATGVRCAPVRWSTRPG